MEARLMPQSIVPVQVVGGNQFGRYSKISEAETYNMIVSDGMLVDYAGYHKNIDLGGIGRGFFSSNRFGNMLAVISNKLYLISPNLTPELITTIDTFVGDVFIDENEKKEIAICDKKDIYIFNYGTSTITKSVLDFVPGYVAYQNGYFIAPDVENPVWRLNDLVTTTSWPNDANHVGTFQTKPDIPLACFRFPGRGNVLFVMGSILTESWFDLGQQLFPYQRSSGFNIDYGCANQATIAFGDNIVVWLAINEKSGPVIVMSDGNDIKPISNDGINFKLAQLTKPQDSYGFLFKQDGHLIYQITFNTDNLSYIYDFTTQMFFTVCDQLMNKHIAKKVVFFNNAYYFISSDDGGIYTFSTNFSTLDGMEMPRIRVTPPIRSPDNLPFIGNSVTFLAEQGDSNTIQRIDLSIAKGGNESFSNINGKVLNRIGLRQNRLIWWNLGRTNEISFQLRCWGFSRFVLGDGEMSIYR
jgi:hypothetical protein